MNNNSIAKKEVLDEISRTLIHIINEDRKGNTIIKICDLLDAGIEQDIFDNFDVTIAREEYEDLLFRIFKWKSVKFGEYTCDEVDTFMNELMNSQKIREKNKIFENVIDKFSVTSDYINSIRKYVLWKYKEIALDLLRNIIITNLNDGKTNVDELIEIAKNEGFKISDDDIKNMAEPMLKKYKKSIKPNGIPGEIGDTGINDRVIQQKIKTLTERMTKMKARFVDRYCKSPRFKNVNKKEIEGKKYSLFKCIHLGMEILVHSLIDGIEIENVVIEFRRMIKGSKKGIKIDVNEIKEIMAAPSGIKQLMQRLKTFNSLLQLSNFQEVIFFMGNFFTEQNKIPKKTAKYIKENFRDHVEKLDKSLFEYTIQKSIKK
ncbi:hypothetical protein ACFL40_04665 [candidate division KSB1 bacterium]